MWTGIPSAYYLLHKRGDPEVSFWSITALIDLPAISVIHLLIFYSAGANHLRISNSGFSERSTGTLLNRLTCGAELHSLYYTVILSIILPRVLYMQHYTVYLA